MRNWVCSRAWVRLFSSTHSTKAWSGGWRQDPTMSWTFPAKKGSVELDMERRPEVLDRGLRHPGGGEPWHGRSSACCRRRGLVSSRLPQQRHEGVIQEGARPSRPAFVVQTHEALGAEAFAPLADRLTADAAPLGYRRIVQALCAHQHDPGAAHPAGGQAVRPGQRLEFLTRIPADSKRFQRTSPGLGPSLVRIDEKSHALSAPLCPHNL